MPAENLPPPPFDGLRPDLILDAVESTGLRCDGRLLALNSYENRVYQVGVESAEGAGFVVAKFYRPQRWSDAQILEEHEFTGELAENEIPVVAPMVYARKSLHPFSNFRFALYPRRGGRAPDLENPDQLEWMGRFMARIHNIGELKPFQHRPSLNIDNFGENPKSYLLSNHFIPEDLLAAWTTVTAQALDGVRACFARAGDYRTLRLHGDCHAGNVLYTDHGPHFVDFDDARAGPAIQDLWMLLSGSRSDMTRQMRAVLEGYETFRDFDRRELHLLEALRTLRLIHYSAWLAERWNDPAFPLAFPFFNTQRYWQDRILELREQIAAMEEGPLVLTV